MANISLGILFVHWLAFLDALQRFFWNYTPQPLLSTIFPALIEGSPTFSPIVHVPRIRDPSDYGNPVDLATICPVPTIFQTPLAMNLSCRVDRPDYDLNYAPLVDSSHYYHVFPDIPVWRPAVPHEDVLPMSASAQVGDDYAQSNMAPYGARGVSFCPVLVGIVYIQSLLHLYMLLMIPSLFNHWFEDVLVYDTLDPMKVLDRSWFLHTSLWLAPWHLLRYAVRKSVPCLGRRIRRVGHKSDRPPIPRIVLIRVDGEAVPVHFVEDHQANADVGMLASLESADLEMHDSPDVASDGGQHQDLAQSLVSDGVGSIATEIEAPPTQTVSQQGEHQGGTSDIEDGIGLGSLTSEFAEDAQLSVNEIPDEQLEISPVLVDGGNEPFQSVEKDILGVLIPDPDALVANPSDCNVDERAGESEQVAFLETMVDDVFKDGTDSLEVRRDLGQDLAFSPRSLANDCDPDESEMPSETVSETSSSVESQDTSTPVKNVRFVIGDNAGAADRWQVPLSPSHTNECTYAWNAGKRLGDRGTTPPQIPVVDFDPLMDEQGATSLEQVTKPVLPVVLSEEQVGENDIVFAETLSPSLTEQPIVNLPSLVATREYMRFVEVDPIVPAALIEDIATRSPLQIFSPIAPAVVIKMSCLIEAEEEQSLVPVGTEEVGQELPRAEHALDLVGTLDDKAAAFETLNLVSPHEDGSCLPSSSSEGSSPVFSPRVESEPYLGDVRTPEVALSALAVSEINLQAARASLVVTNSSPNVAIEVPGTNELGAEVLYETPRYCSNSKDLAEPLRSELQGLEVSIPDATSTRMHRPIVLESPKVPGTEDQVIAEESDNIAITLTGQAVDLSGDLATELPMTKPSERQLRLPNTRKEASFPSMISAQKIIGELNHGKGHEADTVPWEHPSTMSKPPPGRTLSGSIHAPSESSLIPQTNNYIDRTCVLYETPRSASFARPDEGRASTSMITLNLSERRQDLSASIHAPQRISKPEVQSSVSQLRDENNHHHRRAVTNPIVVSEKKHETKPCPPNWAAMPEVVDAFRMFKQASSVNTIRRVSSIAECTNRGPMLGVVGQKGSATNSLNNTSAIANIQSRWTHGSGVLLVRDLVSSDPADFNLRTRTNLRTSKIHGTNTISIRPVLYPGMLDTPPYVLQREVTPFPVWVNADFRSMAAGSTGIQRQQSMLVPRKAEIETKFGSYCWMAHRA